MDIAEKFLWSRIGYQHILYSDMKLLLHNPNVKILLKSFNIYEDYEDLKNWNNF